MNKFGSIYKYHSAKQVFVKLSYCFMKTIESNIIIPVELSCRKIFLKKYQAMQKSENRRKPGQLYFSFKDILAKQKKN